MKKKILPLLMVTALIALVLTPLANASADFSIYGYTDKTYYKRGEAGTLKFWIYNDGDQDLILKNITIQYPWYSPIWGGNETMKSLDQTITVNGNASFSSSFTVPSDGRAMGGYIQVKAVTDKHTPFAPEYIPINVAGAPSYGSLEDMDKIVMLFTVLVVLVIICTVIIAATIFLSARRPAAMWSKEEKIQ